LAGPLLDDPCVDCCSFCDGSYDYMFPRISRCGVVSIFFSLFIVGPSVILDIRHIATVINSIKFIQHSARLIYGTNLEKASAPILVKKLLLMLIAASILECQHVLVSANAHGTLDEYDLALGLASIGQDGTTLCLYDDYFWHHPLIVSGI
jgi:hypothetical protein